MLIIQNTAIIPEHLFQRSGGVESCVVATGLVAVLFSATCYNTCSYMKTLTSGTLNVPASGVPAVGESVNALTEQVNNLQRKYYRALAPDCEKNTRKVCGFKKNHHLCSVYHLIQARRLADIAAGIFYAHSITYSSVPCGALMRPQPESGGRQRGAELFLFPLRNSQPIVSF